MEIKNLKELRKHIEKSINNVLENEAFEMVKKNEIKHIQEDVLDVYSPEIYERRDSLGINDPANIHCKLVKSGVLEVENITKFNSGYDTKNQGLGLVKLIEYGHEESGYLYDYPESTDFTRPRPFICRTKDEIRQAKRHVKAMKLGLKRNKIKMR